MYTESIAFTIRIALLSYSVLIRSINKAFGKGCDFGSHLWQYKLAVQLMNGNAAFHLKYDAHCSWYY